jgi:hypothetical protein
MIPLTAFFFGAGCRRTPRRLSPDPRFRLWLRFPEIASKER